MHLLGLALLPLGALDSGIALSLEPRAVADSAEFFCLDTGPEGRRGDVHRKRC